MARIDFADGDELGRIFVGWWERPGRFMGVSTQGRIDRTKKKKKAITHVPIGGQNKEIKKEEKKT